MGVLLHRAKPERVLWTTQGAQVRTRRSDEISGCGRGIKGAGLQFLFALRATHTKRSFSKRKTLCLFSQETKRSKTLCGTTLGCRPLAGHGRSLPAVTGRYCNGHHTSTLTRVVFQQEAPR